MIIAEQLPLASARLAGTVAGDGLLKLLVFNAQHASAVRASRQASWIAAQEDADLVIITEAGAGPGGGSLAVALARNGYSSVLAPRDGTRDYRTILASRGPALAEVPSGVGILPHRAPAAAVTVAGHKVGLLGLYVPSRGLRQRRNQDKRAFQAEVAQALPAFVARFGGPVIVAGDLNVVEPGHVPHYPVFGRWEYDFYSSFADADLEDAYRARHPHGIDHSWLGRGGNGYRLDHAFITRRHAALIRSCAYLHEPRLQGLTDHAALAMTVTMTLAAP